ncbi:MAG: hypothetical protein ACRC46_00725 [Thermoguttaceae bacterium]
MISALLRFFAGGLRRFLWCGTIPRVRMSSPAQKVDPMSQPPNAERLDQDEFSFDITHDRFFKETFGLKPIAFFWIS